MGQGKGNTNVGDFKILEFYCSFTQSRIHLSKGMDRECAFLKQTSNSFSISVQGFLRTNTEP